MLDIKLDTAHAFRIMRPIMAAASAQTKLLRAVFHRRGFSFHRLARAAQRAPRTIKLVFDGCANALRPRTAHRIEQALGEAIWSDAETFARRRAVIQWLGFDPFDMGLWTLCKKVKRFGVMLHQHPLNRADADAAIEKAFHAAQAAKADKTAKSAKAQKKTSLPPTFADTAIAPERTAEGQHSGRGIKTRTRGAQLGQTLRTPTKREHGAPRP